MRFRIDHHYSGMDYIHNGLEVLFTLAQFILRQLARRDITPGAPDISLLAILFNQRILEFDVVSRSIP